MRIVQKATLVFMMLAFHPLCANADPIWQTSSGPKIYLDIRDKFLPPGNKYKVQFLVSSGAKTLSATKEIDGNKFGAVVFPDDFGGEALDGDYKWQAVVRGKVALQGSFSYKSIGTPNASGFRSKQITWHPN